MKKLLIISCLLLLSSVSMVSAAVVTPETRAAEMLKRYEARMKEVTVKKDKELKGLSAETAAQITALKKEQAEKVKATKDPKQIQAINKDYAARINKLKAQQGIKTKSLNDNSSKETKSLQADLNAVKKQIAVEKKARERDTLKIKQEKAKKAVKPLSTADLKKADEAREAEMKQKLAASRAKRAAEQAAWAKRHPAGSIILDGGAENAAK
jgi:hypothetical protein